LPTNSVENLAVAARRSPDQSEIDLSHRR